MYSGRNLADIANHGLKLYQCLSFTFSFAFSLSFFLNSTVHVIIFVITRSPSRPNHSRQCLWIIYFAYPKSLHIISIIISSFSTQSCFKPLTFVMSTFPRCKSRLTFYRYNVPNNFMNKEQLACCIQLKTRKRMVRVITSKMIKRILGRRNKCFASTQESEFWSYNKEIWTRFCDNFSKIYQRSRIAIFAVGAQYICIQVPRLL